MLDLLPHFSDWIVFQLFTFLQRSKPRRARLVFWFSECDFDARSGFTGCRGRLLLLFYV